VARAARPRSARGPYLAGAAIACAVADYLLWEWHFHDALAYAKGIYPLDDADEWRYVACGRLVVHGYSLFQDVFSAQPPLLFTSLAGGMKLFGDGEGGAHTTEVIFGLLGLLAAAWLAWELGGMTAAAVTAILLAISPAFLVYSHTIEAEGPMMALATLSLAILARHVASRNGWLPVIAGLALAAAILTKLFAVETFLPALWLLSIPPVSRRARLLDIAAFTGAATLPVVLEFLLISPAQQWDQVIRLHNAAGAIAFAGADPAASVLWRFLTFDAGLTLAALGALGSLLVLRLYREAVFVFAWVGGTAVMLLYFHPLFPHHPPILLTGLACTAGIGVAASLERLERRAWARALIATAGAVYLLLAPRLLHADRHILSQGLADNPALVAYIVRHTDARDLIAVDDLRLADESRRLVVPPLCDPSNVRLRAGYLTGSEAIQATERYRPKLVLFSFGIFTQVPGFGAWLDGHYRRQSLGGSSTAYLQTRHSTVVGGRRQ